MSFVRDKQSFAFQPDAPRMLPLQGLLLQEQLRPGLALHLTDIQVLQPLCNETLIEPGLKLILMLQGDTEASLGNRALCLQAAEQAQWTLLATTRDEYLQRRIERPGRQQQLVISLTQQWLEEGGLSAMPEFEPATRFCARHLALQHLPASRQALAIAQSLLQGGSVPAPLQRLRHECLTLQLLENVVSQWADPGTQPPLKTRDRQRIEQLTELLRSGTADHWSVVQMAHACGSNPTSLQRHFRLQHGRSIAAWLRSERLQRARHALQQGSSVLEAALIAGYTGPENFATAFRREFGQAPSQTFATRRLV